jgi:hypothetical protein
MEQIVFLLYVLSEMSPIKGSCNKDKIGRVNMCSIGHKKTCIGFKTSALY